MIFANKKPIKIIGYPESSMTKEFINEITKTHTASVIEPLEFLSMNNKNDYQYIISVTFDLEERKRIIKIVDKLNLDLITVINDTSLVGSDIIIQPGTFIFPFCNLSCNVSSEPVVGRHCIIGAYSLIGHYSRLGNNCILRPGVMITGHSSIGDHCIINIRATITNNATIADNIEILAFANVTKNIKHAGQYLTKTL